eukprot:763759-Hanusia_phi.AAC.1
MPFKSPEQETWFKVSQWKNCDRCTWGHGDVSLLRPDLVKPEMYADSLEEDKVISVHHVLNMSLECAQVVGSRGSRSLAENGSKVHDVPDNNANSVSHWRRTMPLQAATPRSVPRLNSNQGPDYKGMRSQFCNCKYYNSKYSMRQKPSSVTTQNLTSSQLKQRDSCYSHTKQHKCWHMLPPPHALHLDRSRPCSHMPPPPHALHLDRTR